MQIGSHHIESNTARPGIPISTMLTRPYLIPFSNFRAKVRILIDRGDYVVKTADNEDELDMTLRLRHEVFIEELLGKRNLFGVDIDRYDQKCDHLMVVEKSTGRCVGTYRLISDTYSDEFYSGTEFHLGDLPELDGVKLEIGRACIGREFRKSNMMGLLWEGIYAYMGIIRARYVFGCSSVMTMDRVELAALHRYLYGSGYYRSDLGVRPRKKYVIGTLWEDIAAIEQLGKARITGMAEAVLPRLVRDYFKFGARVCGEPALDKNFRCADIFTILDLQHLNDSYREERLHK